MAKGVLAARGANRSPTSRRRSKQHRVAPGPRHDRQRRAHLAEPAGSRPPRARRLSGGANNGDHDELPNLKPASVVRPGQRGTISMMLWNKEDRAVRLTPVSTDLISSTGGRISSQLVEFVPGEVDLEPGEQKEMQGRIAVPVESARGLLRRSVDRHWCRLSARADHGELRKSATTKRSPSSSIVWGTGPARARRGACIMSRTCDMVGDSPTTATMAPGCHWRPPRASSASATRSSKTSSPTACCPPRKSSSVPRG